MTSISVVFSSSHEHIKQPELNEVASLIPFLFIFFKHDLPHFYLMTNCSFAFPHNKKHDQTFVASHSSRNDFALGLQQLEMPLLGVKRKMNLNLLKS